MVVIAILAIIASMLVTVFTTVKRLAGRTAAAKSQRQIGLAVAAYASDNRGFLPGPMRIGHGITYYTLGVVNQYCLGNYLWPYLDSQVPSLAHSELDVLRDRPREAAGFATFWVRNSHYYPTGTKVGQPIDLTGGFMDPGAQVTYPHRLLEINNPSTNIFLQDGSLEMYSAQGPHPATPFYGLYVTLYYDFHVDMLPLSFREYLY